MDATQRRGLQAAIAAFVLWGTFTAYWKQLDGLNPIELIGWRVIAAVAIMVTILTAARRWPAVVGTFRDAKAAARIGIASLLLAVNWTTYVWAVVNDHVLETALGYFLAPLGTIALGVFVLGERLTPLKRYSIASALIAVTIVAGSYGRIPWVALVIAGSWSVYGLTKRRVPLDAIESLSSELLILCLPALVLVLSVSARADSVPRQASMWEWVLVGGTGVVTATPLLLFAYAAKRIPFTVLGPANYLVPMINFMLGWAVFGEALPPSRVVGFGFVWLALAFVTLDTIRRRPTPLDVGIVTRTATLPSSERAGR